jgi:hypothetical protein
MEGEFEMGRRSMAREILNRVDVNMYPYDMAELIEYLEAIAGDEQ